MLIDMITIMKGNEHQRCERSGATMKFLIIMLCILNVILMADAFIKNDYLWLAINVFLLYVNSNTLDKLNENNEEKE